MFYDALRIKVMTREFGADFCGIASASSFQDAPEGFRPTDIYSSCKSVVVFAKSFPKEVMFAENCVPYTHTNNFITEYVDRIGMRLCYALSDSGIGAVPVPSDEPYEYWDSSNEHGRAILSMRHAGYLAGIGVLGRNGILVNKKLGNTIQIGAVLVNIELEANTPATYKSCPDDCSLCIDNCPAGALDGVSVNQKLCRPYSNYRNGKGYVLKKCSICRSICPRHAGIMP
jgi:epoxyqueuosine reductase QueG